MTKYKLPRNLKKAKKHFYLTKEWYELDDKKKFIISRRLGVVGAFWMITLQRMSKPYPETKWIRKYRQHLLNIRKKINKGWFAFTNEAPGPDTTIRYEELKYWGTV
jgi:hypothetical protein